MCATTVGLAVCAVRSSDTVRVCVCWQGADPHGSRPVRHEYELYGAGRGAAQRCTTGQ